MHKNWKEGLVEEVERKFSSREIDMLNEGWNVEIRANNKFLMKNAREHAEAVKGTKVDISKINALRKNKWVYLAYEVLGAFRAKLTNCGRNDLEFSSVSWLSNENAKINSVSKGDRINKASYKIWNNFMKWLRWKKVKVMQDFKEEW